MPHGGTILSFPGQETNEQIFVFVRRYFVAFLPRLILIIGVTLLGLTLIFIIGNGGVLTHNRQVLLASAFLLFMLLFALLEFFDFYFDLNIVTDRRLVDIDQQRLFNRNINELLLEDIQDASAKVKGIFATVFDYGDVMIQTAGAKPNFLFEQVRHPTEIAAIIIDISDQARRGVVIADRHPEGPVAAIIDNDVLPHTPNHENEIP